MADLDALKAAISVLKEKHANAHALIPESEKRFDGQSPANHHNHWYAHSWGILMLALENSIFDPIQNLPTAAKIEKYFAALEQVSTAVGDNTDALRALHEETEAAKQVEQEMLKLGSA